MKIIKNCLLGIAFVALVIFNVYAAWDSDKPAAGDKLSDSQGDIQGNFAAIEAGTAIVDGTTGTSFEVDSDLTNGPAAIISKSSIIFEGATANAFETTFAITDPTADRTITVPNHTGTIAVSGANYDHGAFELRAQILEADVSEGTAPFTVTSTTVSTNLNADLLDGKNPTASFSATTNLYLSGSDGYFAEVVDTGSIKDNAIHQAELYTDTGSQGGNLTANTPVEITMNTYSFFPNIFSNAAQSSGKGILKAVNDNTDSQIGRFSVLSSAADAYDVQWRYVKASDPKRWIFAAFNELENKIQHIWESGDHPFMTDPDAFPNPFTKFKDNPDYEVYLIDNKIWDTLKDRISRNDRVSRIILNEYEVDKVTIPTFKSRTLVEFDEWGDRNGEIIKTYKNKTAYGKTKTLKRRVVNELPPEIKYRNLKAK